MGPTATATYVGGGGSAHVTPFEPITNSLTALRAAAGSGTVDYVQGYDLDGSSCPRPQRRFRPAVRRQNGWLRQQVSTTLPASGSEPAACAGTCAADRLDPTVDYTSNTSTLPAGTAWRWTTHFTVPAAPAGSNSWQLKVFVKNQSSAPALRRRARHGAAPDQHRRLRRRGRRHRRLVDPRLGRPRAGERSRTTGSSSSRPRSRRPSRRARRTSSTFVPTPTSTDPLSVQFKWVPPDWQAQSIAAATAAASAAKKVVIFAFDDGTEGVDRGGNDQNVGLQLPGWQDALISAVAAVNPNMVVVLNTGDAVYMPWLGERQVGARDVVSGRRRWRRHSRRPDRRRQPERQAPDHVPGRLGAAAALPDGRPRLQSRPRS